MEAWAETSGRKFNYWCFHAGVAMSDLIGPGVRSTILASGTLSPLSSFAHEMGIPFKYQLENPHVVSASQFMINVIPRGPKGAKLSSSYENRGSSDYVQDMGNAIVSFCGTIPDGALVFFPSYTIMQKCIEAWKKSSNTQKSIWEQLSKIKEPVVEPKGKTEFSKVKISRFI
jgi:regulator of telomere elongation helicase 1